MTDSLLQHGMPASPFSLSPPTICFAPDAAYEKCSRNFEGIPGIEVTRSGRIWATWYSGGSGEGPDNYVLLVTSNDGGISWSPPRAIVDPPGEVRAFDPGLWMDPLGRLWWYWSMSKAHPENSCYDGRAGVWAVLCTDPDQDAPAWSEPRRLANGIMMNKPTVTSDGAWLFPVAVWGTCKPLLEELTAEQFSNILESRDAGETFILKGGANVPTRTFDEHMVIELRDRRLWMLVRTASGIGQSFSSDGGRTWTPGEPSKLKGPNSRFFIRRLQSGNLIFIGHDSDGQHTEGENKAWPGRSRLKAWLSRDDGVTWEGGLMLDERKNVSYPDGAQDTQGKIHIIHDRERHLVREILFSSFREEDVLAGNCVSPKSFTSRPIIA